MNVMDRDFRSGRTNALLRSVGGLPKFSQPAGRTENLSFGGAKDAIVVIIDSDGAVRQSLQDLLLSVGQNSIAFGSVSEFIARKPLPDVPRCIVLDVRLPGISGLDFQEMLLRSETRIPIVFLTGHADIQMTVRAMKSGAVDFLTKPYRDQDLLDAVTGALDQDRAHRKRIEAREELAQRIASLTGREREVMSLVVTGLMNKQIAAELGLSESTVKLHRGSVMRKLNVRAVPDLVRLADLVAGEPESAGALHLLARFQSR